MRVKLFGSSYANTSSMVTDPLFRFKHVFVTGATGIVGSALCETIADTGIPVTGYSRTSSGDSELSCIQHVSGDILNLEVLRNAVKDSDLIFHLAAESHVDDSIKNPKKIHRLFPSHQRVGGSVV